MIIFDVIYSKIFFYNYEKCVLYDYKKMVWKSFIEKGVLKIIKDCGIFDENIDDK